MNDQYVTLISSLPPHIPKLFEARQTPISRLKLNERLQMLQPHHARDLALIENLVHWDRMTIDTTDEEMILRGEQAAAQIKNEFIREIVRWRLEMRTAVKALRLRNQGLSPPADGSKWGFGRWLRYIEKHWNEPGFGLERNFTWISEAEELLNKNNHLSMERLLLGQLWDYYGRVSGTHYFDFEAVVVYVLRWDVIDRWARYDSEKANQRFGKILDSALGDYSSMFA